MVTSSWRFSTILTIAVILIAIVMVLAVFFVGQDQIILIVLAIGGLAVSLAILQRPAIAVMLLAAFIPLEGVLMIGGHSFAKLITLFCIAVFAAREVATRKGIKLDNISLLLLVFLGWGFTTILWSPSPENSLSVWISSALQGLLYIILLNFVLSKKDLKLALWGFVLGGLLLSIILINDVLAGEFIRKGVVAGLGINLAARYGALTVLISLLVYQLETNRLVRAFLLITLVIPIAGVVVSLSRGAWYGLILSIVALILVSWLRGDLHFNFTKLFSFLLVALMSFFFLSTLFSNNQSILKLIERFQSSFNFEDGASGRFGIWSIGGDMFLNAPIWGHGFNSFAFEFHDYLSRSSNSGGLSPFESKTSHNAFVSTLTELGLIGFLLFLAILTRGFEKIYRIFIQKHASNQALVWATALFVFLIIASTVDNAVNRKYLWFILSIITLMTQYLGEDQTKPLYDNQKTLQEDVE